MNTKAIAGIIGAVVVVGGLWAFGASRSGDGVQNGSGTADGNATTSTEVATSSPQGSFQGTIFELVATGGNTRCEFTQEVEGVANTGVVYVSGQRLRSDVTSTIPQLGMNVKSHVIREGDWIYAWSDMLPQGIKIRATEEAIADAQAGNQQTFDYNQKFDFSCLPWTPDESLFALPSTITFREAPSGQ